MTQKVPKYKLRVELEPGDVLRLEEIRKVECDTISTIIRRMIRRRHKRLTNPNPSVTISAPTFAPRTAP